MADRELHNQMPELDFPEVGFAHGLAASIYVGDIMWNNKNSSSNVSLFTVYALSAPNRTMPPPPPPLKKIEGKSLEEIKASQKQDIKVSATFEEMMQSLRFYGGVITILFGLSCSCVECKEHHLLHPTRKGHLQMQITADVEFAAEFIYAMEIRIQSWLGECQKFNDRSMVNDRIVDFDPLIKMVLSSSLLPNFIVKSATETLDTTTSLKRKLDKGDDRRGKKKRKNNDGEGRIVKKLSPINGFLMTDSS
jgi:hypothetical protein